MDFQQDRSIWKAAENASIPSDGDLSYWGFSSPNVGLDKFQLTIYHNGQRTKATISEELAPMYAYFDLMYWQGYVDSTMSGRQNTTQTTCFLHKLRRLAEEAIQSTTPLGHPLLFWAVRTVGKKNHGSHDAALLMQANMYSGLPKKNGKKERRSHCEK